MTAVLAAALTPFFTPRLVEGSTDAPRVIFLDPAGDLPGTVEHAIAQALDRDGEAVFAVNRYAIHEGYRRLGKDCPLAELPEYGAPEAVRHSKRTLHAVFTATFPSAWATGQLRAYAPSSSTPTIRLAIQVQQWLTDLGAYASNRLLWSRDEF